MSPADEEELSRTILRDQVGVDPRQLTPVLELAALGLINAAWRNTAVEHWHAQGRLHDGDMLRINSHSTWRLRQLLFRWRAEMGFTPDSPASQTFWACTARATSAVSALRVFAEDMRRMTFRPGASQQVMRVWLAPIPVHEAQPAGGSLPGVSGGWSGAGAALASARQ